MDPCDTAGCAQMCTSNNGVATCSCTTGTIINADGKSCDPGNLY